MKTIFGFSTTYDALAKSGLARLSDRREEILKKFALKTAKNPLFEHWFPRHLPSKYNLRKEKQYEEELARTERLRNSPLFVMRRLLNDLV